MDTFVFIIILGAAVMLTLFLSLFCALYIFLMRAEIKKAVLERQDKISDVFLKRGTKEPAQFVPLEFVPFVQKAESPAAPLQTQKEKTPSGFDGALSRIRAQRESGKDLSGLALYISNERESGVYTAKEKELLNEELCRVQKLMR